MTIFVVKMLKLTDFCIVIVIVACLDIIQMYLCIYVVNSDLS